MNKCKTAGGKRLFKTWILQPLKDKEMIELRLESVTILVEGIVKKGYLKEVQKCIRGMPRIEVITLLFASKLTIR